MRTQLGSVGVLAFFALVASCSSGAPEGGATGGTGGGGNGSSGGSQGLGGSSTSSGGAVSCPTGSMACGTNCIDTRTDNLNCGSCGKACAAGQSCSASSCMCTGGLVACPAGCVSTGSDGNNCGACGTVCMNGQVCSQGKCSSSCAVGEMKCDAALGCANVTTDSANCGFCGNKCIGGQACVNGACVCPAGQATCNGACTDVMGSTTNCGSCGKACASGQVCSNGVCGGGVGNTGGTTGAGGAGNTGGSAQGGAAGSTQGGSTQGGSAGSAGSAGAGGAVTNACAKAGVVANFEEGSGAPKVIKQEGRTGEFEIFNDATSTNESMAVEASGGSAECDKWALHVKGGGFTSWGAGVGLSMVGTTKAPSVYNATMNGFTGVRFKAKLGSGSDMKSPVRFNISTPFTESKDNTGGQCDIAALAATTTKAKMDCYQHPGKFLAPGSQLTSSWQTYNFCFDRDLYPLSLPSNMTTEQRNNVGASILKIQFQFNKGKDYSGAYTAMWPTFQPTLPFDFWLDDIEFFKGDCPNTVAMPSNGSPAKAFPQNANVGSCAPATNAKNFNAAIAQAYATWQKNFVQDDHVVAPEQNGDITSEALGYGMMIAAAIGDKAQFDKFHRYVKQQGGDSMKSPGLMTWKNGGNGSASDGDTDIAYALYMANKQWPSGGYKTEADHMAAAILTNDIVSNVVRGGSSFKDAPFNPSYFAPAAYRVFATNGSSGFSSVISTSFGLVNTNVGAGTAGVPTDWASATSGQPSGPGSAQVTSQITDGENGAMGYDSARVPWRLGLDVCLGGGNNTALKQIVDYFAAKYNSGATIDLMKAGWYKKSDGPHPMAKDSQGSYIGPIGVGAMAMNNAAMKDRAFRALLDILESGDFNRTYFPSTVGLLSILAMSGNFPTP